MLLKLAGYAALAASLFLMLLYVWFGAIAFRAELGDFVPTRETAGHASMQTFERMRALTSVVYWQLSDGTRQRAFYRPSTNGISILYTHGSPGNGSGFYSHVAKMAEKGYGGLALDLPGYGGSEGRRNWDGYYAESVLMGVDFVLDKEPGLKRVGAFGYSMGGVAVAQAASMDERIDALVLMSSYTNLTDQLHHSFRRKLPGVGYFALAAAYWSGVAVTDMDVGSYLSRYRNRPLMVIGGTRDRVTPAHMQRTLAADVSGSELWLVDGATHIDVPSIAGEEFYQRLDEYWSRGFAESS